MRAKTQTAARQKPEKKVRQQLGVIVDAALWRRFRATAIQRGTTATTALEAAMRKALKDAPDLGTD
jgi:hypothetical protein